MAAPRKTAGMVTFEHQLDEAFPDRRGPDGWIGDPAHQEETSSHNADDTPGSRPEWNGDPDNIPDVRAVDVWKELGEGVDMHDVVDHLRALPGLATVIRYMIFDGWEYHEHNGFRPAHYPGSNPHRDHLHVTFAFTETADDNTRFDYRFEEIAMPLTPADKQWLVEQLDEAADRAAAKLRASTKPGWSDTAVHNTVADTVNGVLAGKPMDRWPAE
jgi:hypothetical protein